MKTVKIKKKIVQLAEIEIPAEYQWDDSLRGKLADLFILRYRGGDTSRHRLEDPEACEGAIGDLREAYAKADEILALLRTEKVLKE